MLYLIIYAVLEEFPVTGVTRDSVRTTVLSIAVFSKENRMKDAHVIVT
jgi:hypothetical protein